jgi:hypothetical protein
MRYSTAVPEKRMRNGISAGVSGLLPRLRSRILGFACLAIFMIAPLSVAQAVPIQLTFTASGFGIGAPDDSIPGTILWDAASVSSTINSLTSISLTISGHFYTLGEISFASPFSGNLDVIGGTIGGLAGLNNNTDDVSVLVNPSDFARSPVVPGAPMGAPPASIRP